jgi:DNA-binding transcriptional MerR regulator
MATRTPDADKQTLSIGEAVCRLRTEFPDLSISKVRYLEDEGLLKLARTKGGYRLFSEEDIGRLSEILRLQKEHFLPLNVIKERMSGWRPGDSVAVDDGLSTEQEPIENKGPVSLTDALKKTGVSAETIKTLESFGFIKLTKKGDALVVTAEDLAILEVCAELSRFGIEPRHLRMFENQAQKESLLFQQILSARLRHKSSKLRQQSLEDLKELVKQTEQLQRILLEKALGQVNLWK